MTSVLAPEHPPGTVGTAEACRLLGVTYRQLHYWLPHVGIDWTGSGHRVRLDRSQLRGLAVMAALRARGMDRDRELLVEAVAAARVSVTPWLFVGPGARSMFWSDSPESVLAEWVANGRPPGTFIDVAKITPEVPCDAP